MCADIAVRPVGPEGLVEFHRVSNNAFGGHGDPEADGTLAELFEPDRRLGAVDRDRLVGTAASFDFTMTVPGGGTVPVAGVTSVGVVATHRRRGILRQLMAAQLDQVAGRGEPLAVLLASEAGIYRRFGYGVATFASTFELASPRVRFREPVGAAFDLQLLEADAAIDILARLYDRFRVARPGAFAYTPAWWRATVGRRKTYIGGGDLFAVVCEPDGDHGGGFAVYRADHDEADRMVLDVRMMVTDDPVVEARLWRYLVEVDLADAVRALLVPVDSALRWWLTDPRQARLTAQRDWLHARILDVPAALAARRYGADGELVVEVTDAFRPGPSTDGAFALAVAGGEGRCGPTTRSPDLVLDIASLGSLYLGGVRATELAPAGLVTERTPGALARADALFGWPVAPFCPTLF